MSFSIIIPTRNEEKLLPKLLQQLSRLDNRFEIIVSDSNSTDGTLDIAHKYGVRIISSDSPDDNIAKGRNRAAKKTNSQVLIFLNADILISDINNFIKYLENFQKSNFLAATAYVKVFPDSETLADKLFLAFYNRHFRFLNFIGMGMGRGECHIVKKEIFDALGGYNENLIAGEDFELFKRIRKKGKIQYSRDFIIYESPRRYRYYGHWKIFFSWLINSIYMILFKKSKSVEWEPIR